MNLLEQAFQSEDDQPFLWQAGSKAALFVHGFPATPAEMRPLASVLHEQGWTVQAILLPGFGPEIATIGRRRYTQWVAAIQVALTNLQQAYDPVLLVAATQPPSGLVLLAPFWTLGHLYWPFLPILKRLFSEVHPFRWFKPDFQGPELRTTIASILPDHDPDDPATQQAVRDLAIPMNTVDQIRSAGQMTYRLASKVKVSSLVVQGTRDDVVKPTHTRRLVQQIPGQLQYVEIEAGHDLINPDTDAWSQITHTVTDFAETFTI
jgi:carboxylesterase